MTGRTEQEIRADLTLAGRAIVDHGANPPDDVMWRLAGDVLPLLDRVQAAEAKIAAVEEALRFDDFGVVEKKRIRAALGAAVTPTKSDELLVTEVERRIAADDGRRYTLDEVSAAIDWLNSPGDDATVGEFRARPVTPTLEATTEATGVLFIDGERRIVDVYPPVEKLQAGDLYRVAAAVTGHPTDDWPGQPGKNDESRAGLSTRELLMHSSSPVGDTGQADEPQQGCRYDNHGHCPPGTPGCDCWTPGVDRPTGPAGRLVPQRDPWDVNIEQACKVMHDAYERAAAGAGWETQQASRKPWGDVPEANKATMRAAVAALIDWLVERVPVAPVVPQREDDEMFCPNFKRHCDVGARWQEGEPLYKKERRDWLYDQGFKSDQASCDYCNPECPTCNRRERREHAAWIAGRVPVADEGEKPEPRDFHDALVRDERRAGQVVPQQPTDQTRLQARMLMAMVDSKRVWAVSPEGNPDCTLPVLISVSVAAEICAGLVAGRVPVGDEGEAR